MLCVRPRVCWIILIHIHNKNIYTQKKKFFAPFRSLFGEFLVDTQASVLIEHHRRSAIVYKYTIHKYIHSTIHPHVHATCVNAFAFCICGLCACVAYVNPSRSFSPIVYLEETRLQRHKCCCVQFIAVSEWVNMLGLVRWWYSELHLYHHPGDIVEKPLNLRRDVININKPSACVFGVARVLHT